MSSPYISVPICELLNVKKHGQWVYGTKKCEFRQNDDFTVKRRWWLEW